MDSEVIPVELQLSFGMFCDDLEAIIPGDSEGVQQRLVNNLTNLCAIFR